MVAYMHAERDLIDAIRKVLPKKYRNVEITPDLSLSSDLGIDSISTLSLMQVIEDKYGRDIVDSAREKWFQINTVSDLTGVFGRLLSERE